eukprot:207292_1
MSSVAINTFSLFTITLIFQMTMSIIYVNSDTTIPLEQQTGNTWSTSFKSLQTVLSSVANDYDEIWIAHGLYTNIKPNTPFTISNNYLRLYGGFIGNETNLNARYLYNVTTILTGNNLNTQMMNIISRTGCVLDSLSIENNSKGAIYMSNSSNV